jgi:diacylglycerol kinase family enzyme
MDRIASQLEEGDVIISGGGDGTDNLVVDTLLRFPDLPDNVRKTPMLSYRGGNANMGPAELTPKTEYGIPTFAEIFKNGIVADSRPLLVVTSPDQSGYADGETPPQGIEDFLALYFAGIGIDGESANVLHKVRDNSLRRFRAFRKVIDACAVLSGTHTGRKRPFDITETIITSEGSDTLELEDMIEASFVNGKRMAEIGYFPASLTEDEFFKFNLRDPRWRKLFGAMAKMRFEKIKGDMFEADTTVSMEYSTKSGEDIWAHIDGDRHLLPPEGLMEVSLYPTAYRAVTTKPIE